MRQLAIDVGGTFTDCLVLDEDGRLEKFKASTTPERPALGFFAAIERAAQGAGRAPDEFLADVSLIVHGTTLGTNTLLTGRGAATVGLITTAGFRDVIEIRRGIKNLHGSMFEQFIEPYRPLVPRRRRIGVPERTLYTAEVVTELDVDAVARATRELAADGCDAIAIGFLHSYANPTNEQRAKDAVREAVPGIYVTTSHEILPVWREFERFSTTVVSAMIGPAISSYLEELEHELEARGFEGNLLMMLANGLVQLPEHCRDRAVYLLGSGPAAAPSGALELGRAHGRTNLLSVDMGGTSFDVCVVREGEIPTTTEAWEGEERVGIKMVDVSSIGAGGGSIAWIDQLGLLRVGPESAGADPGPAAYGRGDDATVTDADLVLGYIPADYFLGGEMQLDIERARAALAHAGEPLGLSVEATAEAVFATVNLQMANAITEVCTKRGYDVRDFTMVAGGGAGGVHAAAIAEQLSIPEVIIPATSALMSAFGMFNMDLGQEFARSRLGDLGQVTSVELADAYGEMESDATAMFERLGTERDSVRLLRTVDMRYAGQFHEVEIDVPAVAVTDDTIADLRARFHDRYERLYGYAMPWQPVEFLSLYLRATVPGSRARVFAATDATASLESARRGSRRVIIEGRQVEAVAYDRDLLAAGERIEGPALIDDHTTTVLVPERFVAEVDEHRNLILRSRSVSAEPATAAMSRAR